MKRGRALNGVRRRVIETCPTCRVNLRARHQQVCAFSNETYLGMISSTISLNIGETRVNTATIWPRKIYRNARQVIAHGAVTATRKYAHKPAVVLRRTLNAMKSARPVVKSNAPARTKTRHAKPLTDVPDSRALKMYLRLVPDCCTPEA